MGKARRRSAAPPRAWVPREEKLEEPEPGELKVTEEVDDFHERRVEEALAALGSEEEEDVEEEAEEVLGLDLCEDSEEDGGEEEEEGMDEPLDMDSDLEEKPGAESSGLPDESAWGHRKRIYYGTDYGQAVAGSKAAKKSKEEVEAEELEEEEAAQAIQKRLADNLREDDYGLDLLQAYAAAEQPSEKESGRKIAKDLQSLSKKEQLKLLKKESPELLELIQDFEAKLVELRDELEPLVQMVRDGVIPQGKGSQYLQTKYHLYLNYCCNISFYLVLKAKRIPIHGHPVIERLVTYRNLINDLGVVDQRLAPEVRLLLKEFHNGGIEAVKKSLLLLRKAVNKTKPRTVRKVSSGERAEEATDDSDFDEEAALNYYKEMEEKIKSKKKRKHVQAEEKEEPLVEEEGPEQKRGATYQIVKNKGLTPRRKKIDRNPRVKHREKFRRARIRRKGQVREVRREEQRYGGELSGIRAGVKKSIKLK
ncbi:something about silencing protein 10 [Sphaerodactylus townsendi]|uniref:something about silencing protein 10 n=1 Tax=Sphaerodactylus townsendi TaxID=933632 RepID=UPI0020274A38|nr:something about silencing protein 10 [Sphaerodactylus townsendi]